MSQPKDCALLPARRVAGTVIMGLAGFTVSFLMAEKMGSECAILATGKSSVQAYKEIGKRSILGRGREL